MTYTQPIPQGKPEKRRRNYRNQRKKLHSKGINNCYWCNDPITLDTSTLEHIIPLGTNGIDNENNMTLACKECNELRGNVMLELIKV
jgi:5-methylcytosine-specific restriction endonuclease McrA